MLTFAVGCDPGGTDAEIDTTERSTPDLVGRGEDPSTGSRGTPRRRGLKPVLSGLVVTDPANLEMVPYARFATIKSLDWGDVEPRRGKYDFSKIDAILDAHPRIRFRLRLYGGRRAPEWLKEATGGCVVVRSDAPNGGSGCVAQYWKGPYLRAYARLMGALAARFDDDPQVVEITNSACTTIFAEPLILGADGDSVDRLWQAGLNRHRERRCVMRSMAIMMNRFERTRISLAGHHKWQFVVQGREPDEGRFASSWTSARDLFNVLRFMYGEQLVIEDHGLRESRACPIPGGENGNYADSFYCYMAGLSGWSPYGWQFTLNDESMRDTAWSGVEMGACYLEFAGFWGLEEAERARVHRALIENCDFNR